MAELSTIAGGARQAPRMPPILAHREQGVAAGEIGNNQQRNQFQPYQTGNEGPSPENLMKGGGFAAAAPAAAPSEESAEAAPPAVPPEQQAAAAAELQATQNTKSKINRIREDILKSAHGLKGELLKGRFVSVFKHFPGIGALINSFESALKQNIKRAIGILEFIKARLKNFETLVAEGEGLKTWLQVFIEGLETIIVPIILIILFPPWIIVVAMQPKLFSGTARKIGEFIKLNIDPVLEKLKAFSQKTTNEKNAALRTQELEAAVEAQTAAITPPQAA